MAASATLTSADGLTSVDATLSGPDGQGRYTILLQKPIAGPWAGDTLTVAVNDTIVYSGAWSARDLPGPL